MRRLLLPPNGSGGDRFIRVPVTRPDDADEPAEARPDSQRGQPGGNTLRVGAGLDRRRRPATSSIAEEPPSGSTRYQARGPPIEPPRAPRTTADPEPWASLDDRNAWRRGKIVVVRGARCDDAGEVESPGGR